MARQADKIKMTVEFPDGAVWGRFYFWQSDATIIRDALEALPAFLRPLPQDCTVRRAALSDEVAK